jgi:heat shock protein HtpX
LLVAAVSAVYAVMCCLALWAAGLPWWAGLIPVSVALASAEAIQQANLGPPVKVDRTIALDVADNPPLHAVADRLCALTGQAKPAFRLIDSPAPNALAYTPPGGPPTVFVTAGLLERLDTPQLAAVLAHEFAHVTHRDQRVLALARAMTGWMVYLPGGLVMLVQKLDIPICILARMCGKRWKPWFESSPSVSRGLDERHPERTVSRRLARWLLSAAVLARVILFYLFLIFGSLVAAGLLVFALIGVPGFFAVFVLTRRRELAADRAAARATGAPATLAAALGVIADGMHAVPQRDLRSLRSASTLAIVPFKHLSDRTGWTARVIGRLLGSHPPPARRIQRLLDISRQMGTHDFDRLDEGSAS